MNIDFFVPRLSEIVSRFPSRIAVKSSTQSLSYIQLENQSNRIANFLHDRVNSIPHVITLLDRSLELIAAILGIFKAGLVFVPLNPNFPPNRVKVMIDEVKSNWIITTSKLYNEFESVLTSDSQSSTYHILLIDDSQETGKTSLFSLASLNKYNESCLSFQREFKEECYIYFTSGSTGIPKGVVGRQTSLAHFIQWEIKEFGIDEQVKVSQLTPPTFDPFLRDIFLPLMSGGTSCIPSQDTMMNMRELIRWIDKNEITLIHTIPSLFKALVSEVQDGCCLQSLKYILLAGELLRGRDIYRFIEIFGSRIQLVNIYGPTETTLAKLFYRINPEDANRSIIPVGKPIEGAQVLILDEKLRKCPTGKKGEIYIRTPFRSAGYYNDPDLNEKLFIMNPFGKNPQDIIYKTGDLGSVLPDGYIELSGRADFQVKIRGVRIELAEIENRMLLIDGIKDAVVIAREEEGGDKYLCAYVVLLQGKNLDTLFIKKYLSNELPEYMIPQYVIFLEKIPLTPNGKVDRKALPEPQVTSVVHYAPPENETEKVLLEIWLDILGKNPGHISQLRESMGVEGNFFDFGGHSLKATVLTSRINKEFDVRIPLAQFFKQPTIRGLAEYIQSASRDKYASIEPAEEREYYPLSSAQERLYILHRFNENNTAYNIANIFPIEGHIDKDTLEKTFQQLVTRHESLRTSFHIENELPVQRIHKHVDLKIEYVDASQIRAFVRPFDLSRAPLIRVGLVIKKDENQTLLITDMHHIITDGTSQIILRDEFRKIYSRNETELSPLRLQYKDYAMWLNSPIQQESIKEQEDYWLKIFPGEVPVLLLPTDSPRPDMKSFEGKMAMFSLNPEETRFLKELAKQCDATLFMSLLSVFIILLSKLTRQEDIVVGTPVAARRHADLEKIIGMFVNTLPLRNFPSEEKSIIEFLGEIKTRTLEAFENQEYPFEELVDKLSLRRDTGRNPIFDVMFTYQNLDFPTPGELPGDSSEPRQTVDSANNSGRIIQSVKFDITLFATEVGDNLVCSFQYCTVLFKKETISRYISYLKNIIAQLTKESRILLGDIEIISEEEKKQILIDFNATRSQYPEEKTVDKLFEEQVIRTPDQVAVVGISHIALSKPGHENKKDKKDDIVYLTYRELNEISNRMARVLRNNGVNADSISGLMIEPSIETIIGIFSILKAGGGYLPLDTQQPAERRSYMLKDSRSVVLLTSRELSHDVIYDRPVVHFEDAFFRYEEHDNHERFSNPSSIVYTIYTSGTTGKPKGTLIEHKNLVNYATWFKRKAGVNHEDRALLTSSYAFDLGYTSVYPSLLSGGVLHIISKENILSSESLLQYICRHQVTYIKLTPSLFGTIIESSEFSADNVKSLRLVVLGGEPIKLKDVETLHAKAEAIRVMNHYGPTETTVGCIAQFIDFDRFQDYKQRTTIGNPIDNMRLSILDNKMNLVPIGIPGELCISGAGVGRGYLNRPDLTVERFINNPHFENCIMYRTGDMARWTPQGTIEFMGRIDTQVKIRGFRVELGEIEALLLTHESVKEALVIDRTDDNGDKYLCAYIISREDKPLTGLREYFAPRVPDFLIPSFFVPLEQFPLTPNGKIDRNALPEPEFSPVQHNAPPRNEREKKLLEIWSDILGKNSSHVSQLRESMSIDDNFFEFGGHSLKAIVLTSRISKEFNVKIPLAEFFNNPTIKGLSEYIQHASHEKYAAIEPIEEKEYYPLSPAQMRLYILFQMAPENTHYNLPRAYTIEGDVQTEKIEIAFRQLIQRHESLRTSFEILHGDPMQRVHERVDFKIEYFDATQSDKSAETIFKNFIRPFDLSQVTQLRAGLIKLDSRRYLLIIDRHHIISDFVSTSILIQDFFAIFQGKELPELWLQYKDYSQWLAGDYMKESIKKQEQYWLKTFSGPLPVLRLPTDFPRPEIQDYAGSRYHFFQDEDVTGQLKSLALKEGVTLQMLLFSMVSILFAKLSGQEDIIIGAPSAGRPHQDLQKIIGLFINTLALRSFPLPGKSFIQFLAEVKENSLAAYDNQEYPFDQLVEKLKIKTEKNRNPLFDVIFEIRDMEPQYQEQPVDSSNQDLRSKPFISKTYTTIMDIDWFCVERGNKIWYSIIYSTRLFKLERIEKMAGRFMEIVKQVLNNTEIKIGDITISHDFIAARSAIESSDEGEFGF